MTIGVSEPSLDQYLKYGHCSFRDQSRRNLIFKYISAKLLQILNIIVLFIYVMKCNTCYTLFSLQQSIKAALFVHIKISINPLSGKIRGFLCLTCLFCQLLYSFCFVLCFDYNNFEIKNSILDEKGLSYKQNESVHPSNVGGSSDGFVLIFLQMLNVVTFFLEMYFHVNLYLYKTSCFGTV